MERFFQETWFLWLLLALVAIVRWYSVNLEPGGRIRAEEGQHWRDLYRAALDDRGPNKWSRITEAEEAIGYELIAHPFTKGAERRSLQEAMNNLRVLRDNPVLAGNAEIKHAVAHRSTTRNRLRHSWRDFFAENQ